MKLFFYFLAINAYYFPSSVLASVVPSKMDPDVFFDNIGGHLPKQNREDLNNGKATTSLGGSNEGVRSTHIQTDGKILLVGRSEIIASDFAIVRLNPDGSLDPSYNTTGKVLTEVGTGDDWAHAAILQTDGKLVAAGKTEGLILVYDFAAARYLSNGSLDTTFNTTGTVSININSNSDIARGITYDSTGRIMLVGYTWTGTKFDTAIVRLSTNGALDTSYNTTGIRTLAMKASDNAAMGAVMDGGSLVVAGPAYNGTNWDFGIAKFSSDGTLDATFGTSGTQFASFGTGNDSAYGIKSVPFGGGDRFVVVGSGDKGSDIDFGVLRLLNDGSLDTSFNSTGKASHSLASGADSAVGLVIQSDGNAIVAGYSNTGSKDNFAMVRLLSSGNLDTSFNSNGKSSISIGSNQDRAQSIGILNDGTVFVGGRHWNGSNFDFGVIRLNWDGTPKKSGDLDLSFGTD